MNNQADIKFFRARRKKCEKILLAAILFLFLLAQSSCDTAEPLPEGGVGLSLEEVSCTEIWLTLTVVNLSPTAYIQLYQNGTLINTIDVISIHTPLLIDSLSPGTEYIYEAFSSQRGNEIRSNKLTVNTLDTTSHNFTWQTFTFGEHGNSVLFDVAIVGNEIWAVGQIYMKDSLNNPDNNFYNLIKWNGIGWNLERVYYNYQGANFLAPLRSIYSFSENDVWVGSNQPMRWTGTTWEKWDLLNNIWEGWINKLWGSSSSDLYVVGNNGNIAHYNGSQWTKIESGTDVDLLDIWGSPDGTVWACGYNSEDAFTALLRYDGIQWNKVYEGSPNNQNNNEYIGPIAGVWTNSNFFTYVTNWAFIYKQPNNNTLDIKRITPWFSDVAFAMRGTDHNNIFIAGQDGLVGHYNGVTYSEFNEIKENAKNYLGVAVKDNIAVAVGVKYGGLSSQAVISIGNR